MQAGPPLRALGKNLMQFEAAAMSALIARLSGLPPAAVLALPGCDWGRCATAIATFLRRWNDAGTLMDRYFEAARWWGDIDHVMRLTPQHLAEYLRQAARVAKLERPR